MIRWLALCYLGNAFSPNVLANPPGAIELGSPLLEPSASRQFEVQYVARISPIPRGTSALRVWIPVPSDSAVQIIQHLSFSQSPELHVEPKYGNRIAYWQIHNPAESEALTMRFTCTRREMRVGLDPLRVDGDDPAASLEAFRQPGRLAIVDDGIRQLSSEITQGKTGTTAKARAIYDYVIGHMQYNRNQPGAGTGSTRFAQACGRGNCTDFHSLFISLCQAQGIAAAFQIGLLLPYQQGSREPVSSYHCWALFRVPGQAWVPVDCSEASRHPELKEQFFGSDSCNRVALSTGRDLVLEPPQKGPPINFFVNPWAEADGTTVNATHDWSYRDLDPNARGEVLR